MALVRSIFGTQFSQKQGQVTQNNKKKCLPRRFMCSSEGSPSPKDNKRREKHAPKIKVALKTPKKNNMQANKSYISTVLRHVFAIVLSQISTMMEPSNAILEHETSNRWEEIGPRDSRPIIHDLLSYGAPLACASRAWSSAIMILWWHWINICFSRQDRCVDPLWNSTR